MSVYVRQADPRVRRGESGMGVFVGQCIGRALLAVLAVAAMQGPAAAQLTTTPAAL
jgi:hypothetical protein